MRIAILSNVNMDILAESLKKLHSVFIPPGYGQWMQECMAPSDAFTAFAPEMIFVFIDGNAFYEQLVQEKTGIIGPISENKAKNNENKHASQAEENKHASQAEENEHASRTIADAKENIAACAEKNRGASGAGLFDQAFACVRGLKSRFPETDIWISNIDIRSKAICENDVIRAEKRAMLAWDELLQQSVSESNIHIFDLQDMIAAIGRDAFYSDKMWYMGSIPYSMKGFARLSGAVAAHIRYSRAVRKKVLVLDLDNTLWGGIAGEDGLEGIVLSDSMRGAVYKDLQRRIAELAQTGVLLAVASKNNETDVHEILQKHPHMVLREKDFAEIMVNWDEKSENIKKIAKNLNLGLDSFVFLDDNPLEREKVKIALPEVTVADFPRDAALLPARMREIAEEYFFTYSLTAEDTVKTEQYRQEKQRKTAKEAFSSIQDYIRSLGIEIEIGQVQEAQLHRVAQLTQKTNQFNLTALRFSPEQLAAYAKAHIVYVAAVRDKYGENGLVAAVLLSVEGERAIIDNFLMSCRVMGRYIENAFMAEIEGRLRGQCKVHTIEAKYIPSEKNSPVEKLMEKLGYALIGLENGTKRYQKNLKEADRLTEREASPAKPQHKKSEEKEGLHQIIWKS